MALILAACAFALSLGAGQALATDGTWSGSGTQEDPYLIEDAADLQALATAVNSSVNESGGATTSKPGFYGNGQYWALAGDIDLSGIAYAGIGDNKHMFEGSFDGRYYTVRHVDANKSKLQCFGLFGHVRGATIENVIVADSRIVGASASVANGNSLGFIVGFAEARYEKDGEAARGSIIRNCGVDASCVMIAQGGAGIVGGSEGLGKGTVYGTTYEGDDAHNVIAGCYNSASVSVEPKASGCGIAGIVASPEWTDISDCYNTGDIRAYISDNPDYGYQAAGIATTYAYTRVGDGTYRVGPMTIERCYNIGNISAQIDPSNTLNTSETLSYNYICSVVSASARDLYGIFNEGDDPSLLPGVQPDLCFLEGSCVGGKGNRDHCYQEGDTSLTYGLQFTTPHTEAELKGAEVLTNLGDAFAADLPDDAAINGGYPVLKWQLLAYDADYSAVEAAIASVPADLSGYTDESVAALQEALDAVVEGKSAAEQAEVDTWAEAIEAAVAALEEKAGDTPSGGDQPSGDDPSGAEPAPATHIDFTDVPDDYWAAQQGWIGKAVAMGLMSGYKGADGQLNGLFGPEDNITRGQVAVVLFRSANPDSKATTEEASYEANTSGKTDVPDRQYFTAAVNWAVAQGIMTGDANGTTWRPDDNITRQELATTLARFAEGHGVAGDGAWKGAPDAASVSAWAQPGTDWCFANGVMTGQGTTHELTPWNDTKRSEACKMIVVTVELESA